MPGTNMKYTKYKQIRSGGFFKVYSTLSMDNLRLMIQYLWKYSFVNKKETNTLLYREIERHDLTLAEHLIIRIPFAQCK